MRGQVEGGEVCLFQATTYLICSVICMNRDVIHAHFLAIRPVRRECPATPVGASQVSQLLYRSSALPKLTQVSHVPLTPLYRRPETDRLFLIFQFLSPIPSISRTEVLCVREGAVKSPTTATELLRVLH